MDLRNVEQYAEIFYTTQNQDERRKATEALAVFYSSLQRVPELRYIMENATSPWTIFMATSALTQLVTKHWNGITDDQSLELRNFLLQYLWERGPGLMENPNISVYRSIIKLLCVICKLGWLNNEQHRDAALKFARFVNSTPAHKLLGLEMIQQMLNEIQENYKLHSIAQHRKVALSFRDVALQTIFEAGIDFLKQFCASGLPSSPLEGKIHKATLTVILLCLNYDFIGTSPDESGEDISTIQVPATWREIFENEETINIFFTYYAKFPPELASLAMECLVSIVSVRKALFAGDIERRDFLARIVQGTINVMKTEVGLQHKENHHEFCRMLTRLRSSNHLASLTALPNYIEWISLLAQFTVKTFSSMHWAPNSVYYLLSVWSSLVKSMPYLKGNESRLPEFAPKIAEAYIASRVGNVKVLLQNPNIEDPLDSEDIIEQLSHLPSVGRCDYGTVGHSIVAMFDPLANQYQQLIQSGIGDANVLDGQLAWLVYCIGALVQGRAPPTITEENDLMDGELSFRIFKLLQLHDRRMADGRPVSKNLQKLELANVYFIDSFRKIYVTEQAVAASHVYKRLSEGLGLNDHLQVMQRIIHKICKNLLHWRNDEEVVRVSLALFKDMVGQYGLLKKMAKLDVVEMLLKHHSAAYFPFVNEPANAHSRTVFYATLSRLLLSSEDDEKFAMFVQPFQETLQWLRMNAAQGYDTEEYKTRLVGLLRDLRGIVMPINNKYNYLKVFEWIYPDYIAVIVHAAEHLYAYPDVMNPLLKFMAEFVHNYNARLTFDYSSPNSILLFKETAKVLVAYGSRVVQFVPDERDEYRLKYRGVLQSLVILSHSVGGHYVNFGVFGLYNDPCLDQAMDVSLKLALDISEKSLLAYPKLRMAYFCFMHILCQEQLIYLARLDHSQFAKILAMNQIGLKNFELNVFRECTGFIEYLTQACWINRNKKTPLAVALRAQIAAQADLLAQSLGLLFQVLLFSDSPRHWQLPAPIFGLIVILPEYYEKLKNEIINSQPVGRREKLAVAFNELMDGVEMKLVSDKFPHNLLLFRQSVRQYIVF